MILSLDCVNMSLAIETVNLTKRYGRLTAVDKLNLNVTASTIHGFLGPNGAGKTTTIKMILGLLKPDSGKVEVFGQNPWDNPEIRPLIGVVHEKAYFPSHQKTQDYLERTCRIFGVPEFRALDVLKLVSLQEARNRQIKALSAGMLQKFSIAHALIHSPRLVIADEMTANLDPQARSSLFELVLRLHKEEGATFLMSSHILPELSRICDSVAIVNQGKVWAAGRLSELYEKYAAGIVRISTDEPEKLASEVRKLSYVKKVETDIRGISVQVQVNKEESLYEDASKMARAVKAKISGIETGSASIDELYKRVVGTNKEG
jgi:ABC-type multidrug transport system ATPase subunit